MPAYRKQVEAFRRKFGREMAPEDPFFFDPRADTPEFRPPEDVDVAVNALAELMSDLGMAPEIIFAFKRTGGLISCAERPLTSDQQREWDAAIHEYRTRLTRSRAQ